MLLHKGSRWARSVYTHCAVAVQALYCADPLIAALLASGAQHYLEFKLVQARYVAGTTSQLNNLML